MLLVPLKEANKQYYVELGDVAGSSERGPQKVLRWAR